MLPYQFLHVSIVNIIVLNNFLFLCYLTMTLTRYEQVYYYFIEDQLII